MQLWDASNERNSSVLYGSSDNEVPQDKKFLSKGRSDRVFSFITRFKTYFAAGSEEEKRKVKKRMMTTDIKIIVFILETDLKMCYIFSMLTNFHVRTAHLTYKTQ